MKNIIYKVLIIVGFVSLLVGIIAFGRGFRLDIEKKTLTSTGILSINSYPKAAKIFVNNELKGITNSNISLSPNTYRIEIKKEGYTTWKKTVVLKGELVLAIDALLFPLNPSLSPLTNLGIIKAVPLDQTELILLFSDNNDEEKDGIYLFDAGKKTLSLLPPLQIIVFKKNIANSKSLDFKKAEVAFSPDFTQAIVDFPIIEEENIETTTEPATFAYLLSLNEENTSPINITSSKQTLIDAWNTEKEKDYLKILEIFPKEIVKIASDSLHIVSFSPDETKVLYRSQGTLTLPLAINPPLIATNQTKEERTIRQNTLYLYDKKEDKNYLIGSAKNIEEDSILWYPDSQHLIFLEEKKIAVFDYDKTNNQTVYSGPFTNSFFTVTKEGKVIVLTNLNPETNKYPDLYLVGIR